VVLRGVGVVVVVYPGVGGGVSKVDVCWVGPSPIVLLG